jgi:hypothetical protein
MRGQRAAGGLVAASSPGHVAILAGDGTASAACGGDVGLVRVDRVAILAGRGRPALPSITASIAAALALLRSSLASGGQRCPDGGPVVRIGAIVAILARANGERCPRGCRPEPRVIDVCEPRWPLAASAPRSRPGCDRAVLTLRSSLGRGRAALPGLSTRPYRACLLRSSLATGGRSCRNRRTDVIVDQVAILARRGAASAAS